MNNQNDRGVIMPNIDRLTITMPTDMVAMVKAAVEDGDYASTSEVVREALRDWRIKRSLQLQELASSTARRARI